MVSFSHDEYGYKLACKKAKRIQELYDAQCKKPDPEILESLDTTSKERYLIGIEEENRHLKENLWHTLKDKG